MNTQDDLRNLWHNEAGIQPGKRAEEMLTLVIERTRRFDRQIAMRNSIECIAAALVVGMFAWFAWKAPNEIIRAGMAMVALSGVWIAFYILRYGGGPKPLDPGMDLSAYPRILEESYERQIRLLRRVKYWYLLPPYIGLVVGSVGLWSQLASEGKSLWAGFASLLDFGVTTVVFAFVWILNERYGVRKLERLRDELRALEIGGSQR